MAVPRGLTAPLSVAVVVPTAFAGLVLALGPRFRASEGVHPKAIHEQAGHASITTTLDRYGHLLPSAGEQIKAALSNTFTAGEAGTVAPLHATG